jgi:hypothetical protein
MGFVASTLAGMSVLHLAGTFGRGTDAGIAEAVIGAVLVAGAVALARGGDRRAALAATAFAIAGFLVGLRFTIDDGGVELAYHLAVLPLLVLTLTALIRARAPYP